MIPLPIQISPEELLARLPGPDGGRSVSAATLRNVEIKFYAPRGTDPQTPHDRDEWYIVQSGSGLFFRGEECVPFKPGDLLFVEAGVEHRFVRFSEDIAVWVIFVA